MIAVQNWIRKEMPMGQVYRVLIGGYKIRSYHFNVDQNQTMCHISYTYNNITV